jgi:GT2 family glycosyltransferase
MDVSAVVLSFNSKRYIQTCVESLVNSFEACGLTGEVLVVENGSHDGSVAALKVLEIEFPQALKVFYQAENTGTTRSRNLALKSARGKAVLILDSDAYMNPEALRGMLAYLHKHTQVGLVAPRLTYPDGRFQLSVDVFPTVLRKLKRLWALREMEREHGVSDVGAVDYAISACWLLRSETVAATGLLDERIFYSPEDVDYCIRIWQAGWQVHYFPSVSVVHDAQEISRPKGLGINKFTVRHAKGLAYLFFKHRYALTLHGLHRRIGRMPQKP